MFEELLNDYQTQLELFEEVALRQFEELEDGGFAQLEAFTRDTAETGPLAELLEAGFSSLNEYAFSELILAKRL